MWQDVVDRPGFQLKRAQSLFRSAAERQLRQHGLTMAGYAVMRALADQPRISAADLARRVFVTRQTLGGVVAGLVDQGWVVQHQPGAATGGRVRPLALTRAGRRALDRAEKIVTQVEDTAITGFSPTELSAVTRLLTRFADNLVP